MTDIRQKALTYLYTHLRRAKHALARAEAKPNAPAAEQAALRERIDILDYIIPQIIRAEEDDT